MYTVVGPHIPASTFVVDSKILSKNRNFIESTGHIFLAIIRAGTSSDQALKEAMTDTATTEIVLGHCFLYDAVTAEVESHDILL